MIARYWLLIQAAPTPAQVATSQELRLAGVSRLRCVHLGKCTFDKAKTKAGKLLLHETAPASVCARNVRLACDSGNGARWGLGGEQISRLRSGQPIEMEDSIGRFVIGYTLLEPNNE